MSPARGAGALDDAFTHFRASLDIWDRLGDDFSSAETLLGLGNLHMVRGQYLEDGVHWYDPVEHALVRIGRPAGGEGDDAGRHRDPVADQLEVRGTRLPAHLLGLAARCSRRPWRWRKRSVDVPRLWTRFPDAVVSTLVGADGVQEFPIAIVGLGEGEPAIRPAGHAIQGSVGEAPTEFPLITHAQHAGNMERLADAWAVVPPLGVAVPGSDELDTVILRRGSARSMDPEATVPGDAFQFMLAAALRGTTVPHFVAVHAVDGVEPGLYRWPDLGRPLRHDDLRQELLLACWDMDLGRDAAFVVMSAIDLDTIDDRGYREAQLDAGIMSGRLHLGAYALGTGASGMSFLDSEIEPLLGASLGRCCSRASVPRPMRAKPAACRAHRSGSSLRPRARRRVRHRRARPLGRQATRRLYLIRCGWSAAVPSSLWRNAS